MALRCLLQVVLFPAVALAASISSCGAPGDRMSDVKLSLSPDPITKGSSFTITMDGTLDSPLDSMNVVAKLDVKLLGLINEKVDKTIPIKQSPAMVAGPQKFVIGPVTLPSDIPGSATISGTVTLTDASAKQVACINLDMNVPALASDEPEFALDDQVQSALAAGERLTGGVAISDASNCGKPTDHFKDIKVSAAGGVDTLSGTLDEELTSMVAKVDITISALFVHIPIKLDVPISYTPGIPKGPVTLAAGPVASNQFVSAEDPRITIKVSGQVEVDDGNSQEIGCVSFKPSAKEHDEKPSLVV